MLYEIFLRLSIFVQLSIASPLINSDAVQWFSCPPSASINNNTDGGISLRCGSLRVPLDYTVLSSNQTIQLQLTKVNATIQPSRGSIILNPGGPGSVGAAIFLEGPAEALLLMTGGAYDLITFNPRGTGQTLPFPCFTSQANREAAQLLTPTSIGDSNTAINQIWASDGALADLCLDNAQAIGDYIGTIATARDMFSIVDALHEDGLLRYWGFSYGTVLEATAAALFPDRVDKMVLDGNVGLNEYYTGTQLSNPSKVDAAISGFFAGCLASPDRCSLAANKSSANQLEAETHQFLHSLKRNPIPAPQGFPTMLTIDFGAFQSFLQSIVYFPAGWPIAAEALDALFRGNITGYLTNAAIATTTSGSALPDPDVSSPDATNGIRCGDTTFRTSNLTVLKPYVKEIESQSRFVGSYAATSPTLLCPQWKMQAKETYTKPFTNIRTKGPVLFIGNTVDSVTPLINAQASSAGFIGSVVLTNKGYCHTSAACPSICVARHVLDYFLNNKLPTNGTVCEHDYAVFDTPSSYLGLSNFTQIMTSAAELGS